MTSAKFTNLPRTAIDLAQWCGPLRPALAIAAEMTPMRKTRFAAGGFIAWPAAAPTLTAPAADSSSRRVG